VEVPGIERGGGGNRGREQRRGDHASETLELFGIKVK
jgi:hypothetical protein